MISQFVSPYQHRLLGDLDYDFPAGTQAVGRLDEMSEGLLILTTDKSLTRKLLHPKKSHKRSYNVMVERIMEQTTIDKLKNGIEILIKGRGLYKTRPCEVTLIDRPEVVYEGDPAFKEYVPHCWLQFILTEGKNRQIRKMCKEVRHKCKRLIRTGIEDLQLGDMKPGEVREFNKLELFALLKLNNSGEAWS